MKKFKLLAFVPAAILVTPVVCAVAATLSFTEKYSSPKAEPTPMGQQINDDYNSSNSLCSGVSDYDGRIKQTTYSINGEECTVVMMCGESFVNEPLPDGMSEWEVVYKGIPDPTPTPIVQQE